MAMGNVVTIAAYWQIYWLKLIGLVQRSAATWCCATFSHSVKWTRWTLAVLWRQHLEHWHWYYYFFNGVL